MPVAPAASDDPGFLSDFEMRVLVASGICLLTVQLMTSSAYAQGVGSSASGTPGFRAAYVAPTYGFGIDVAAGVDGDLLDRGDSVGSALGLRAELDWLVFSGSEGLQYSAFVRWTEHWAGWRMDVLMGASSRSSGSDDWALRLGAELRMSLWPHVGGVLFRGHWRVADEFGFGYTYVGVGRYLGWDAVS
jgi:hypothetical protein